MYNVLIVDDDFALRYILKRFHWKDYNFNIIAEASDGKEALEIINKLNIDLVITDIRMPGMDGIELISQINKQYSNIGIILLSTYNDFEYAQQGIRHGILDYLTKPVNSDELIKALNRATDFLQNYTPKKEKVLSLSDSLPEYFYEGNKPDNLIVDICNLVLANICNINLELVSNELQLSKDYICRVFKKKTNMSFLKYVTRVKMEYAKQLIIDNKYKTYEISSLLGYKTTDYFTKLFKNYTRFTPSEYRSSKIK